MAKEKAQRSKDINDDPRLRSKNPKKRAEALSALAESAPGATSTLCVLLDAGEDPSENVRNAAVKALAMSEFGELVSKGEIWKVTEESNPIVRRSLIVAAVNRNKEIRSIYADHLDSRCLEMFRFLPAHPVAQILTWKRGEVEHRLTSQSIIDDNCHSIESDDLTQMEATEGLMMSNDTSQSQNGTVQWKSSLHSYDQDERRVLTFANREDINAALDLVWTGSLRGMPFDLVGGDSIIVPKNAVGFFSEAGLQFNEELLLKVQELTDDELNDLRSQGIY